VLTAGVTVSSFLQDTTKKDTTKVKRRKKGMRFILFVVLNMRKYERLLLFRLQIYTPTTPFYDVVNTKIS
jgi:hypothetical protein